MILVGGLWGQVGEVGAIGIEMDIALYHQLDQVIIIIRKIIRHKVFHQCSSSNRLAIIAGIIEVVIISLKVVHRREMHFVMVAVMLLHPLLLLDWNGVGKCLLLMLVR